jgi:hypothetical protein
MGDPMWRLATSINYVSEHIFELKRWDQIEIVVCDWGSETPISQVIALTEKAASITKFVHVYPQLAQELQKDSPFGEVYALNVAARRSEGLYIGRIDQDTLVTIDFLKRFFDTFDKKSNPGFDMKNSYMFAARKQLPYAFVEQKPSIEQLDQCIKKYSKWIVSEELRFCHWASPVGILMMHRDIWDDIGGYDERLIYYWFMDVDLATRLIRKYPIVNIGKAFGYNFFHLEHIPNGFRFRHSHRKLNPAWSKSFDKPVLNPNGPDWGLNTHNLETTSVSGSRVLTREDSKKFNSAMLGSKILTGTIRRWSYYQIKHAWYLLKRLRKKPYL